MFRRLYTSDGPIFGGGGGEGGLGKGVYTGGGGLIFGIIIMLHIWGCISGGGLYTGGILTGFYGIWYLSIYVTRKNYYPNCLVCGTNFSARIFSILTNIRTISHLTQ